MFEKMIEKLAERIDLIDDELMEQKKDKLAYIEWTKLVVLKKFDF